MKNINQCYKLNDKSDLVEVNKFKFIQENKLSVNKFNNKTWKEIIKILNIKEIYNNIFSINNYFILLNKTKDDLEKALKLKDKNTFKLNLDGFNKENEEILNYVLFLQINIAQHVKDREVALVYDKNGAKNQDNQWLFKVEGKSDSLILDLASNTDVFHLLQPYTDAIIIVSHNHPNNCDFSLNVN